MPFRVRPLRHLPLAEEECSKCFYLSKISAFDSVM